MSNLVLFQKQLQSNNAEGVRQFLAELPRISANEGLRQAGEAFGFATVEIEGVRYMLGRDLAKVGYGRTHTGSLQGLLKTYDRELLSLVCFPDDRGTTARQGFSLNSKDRKSTLATWGDLLIVGMKGETEAARKIMAYLLEKEEQARVSQACETITGLSPRQLETASEDLLLQSLEGLVQVRRQQIETQKALATHDRVLESQAQTLTVHDQVLADQGKKIKTIAATQDEELGLTAEQEKTLNAMMNRLISARAFARKLPASQVAPSLWNWIKQRMGIRAFRTVSRARYPMAVEILQAQISREETEGGQVNLQFLKPSDFEDRKKR